MIQLYDYFRSTACYRVRIALLLKNLSFTKIQVHLVNDGGQQHQPEYLHHNPQGLVPTLVDGETTITQSIAIMEYLEEKYPKPTILPPTAIERAHARAIAQLIACDIHPLNNLRVMQYLTTTGKFTDEAKSEWYQHWITTGFTALEIMLENIAMPKAFQVANKCHAQMNSGAYSEYVSSESSWQQRSSLEGEGCNMPITNRKFCLGDYPTIADICLVAQVYNANRFNYQMDNYPLITTINAHCCTLPEFIQANPDTLTS